jgi:hypothetical protein
MCIWPISLRTRSRSARVPTHLKLDVMDLHNRSRIEPGHASQRRRPDGNSRTEIKFIAVHWHSLCTYIQTHTRKVKRREHFDCLGAALVLMWDASFVQIVIVYPAEGNLCRAAIYV